MLGFCYLETVNGTKNRFKEKCIYNTIRSEFVFWQTV